MCNLEKHIVVEDLKIDRHAIDKKHVVHRKSHNADEDESFTPVINI